MAQSTITPEQAQELIEDGRTYFAMAHVKSMEAQTFAVNGMAVLQALGRGLLGVELPDFEAKPMPQWSG